MTKLVAASSSSAQCPSNSLSDELLATSSAPLLSNTTADVFNKIDLLNGKIEKIKKKKKLFFFKHYYFLVNMTTNDDTNDKVGMKDFELLKVLGTGGTHCI